MRSAAAVVFLFLLASISSLLPNPSESAVLSIDLGSEWLKVAVVNLKPGQIPISIALNEMSKRKSPALVGFHSGDRLVGEEAAGIAARYPDRVFSHARDMVGKPYQHVKSLVDSLYLPFDLVEDSRGAVGIRAGDEDSVYSPEELLAMLLSYATGLAEAHARVPVRDAVIAVPPFFGQAERKGVMQAAQLAGINVLGLINEHAGAALQYGIDKDFSNESRHVIFYDMGSSSTYAALVHFSAYNAKEFGKTTSVNQFLVKDIRWNSKLGGQDMELRLVDYFSDEFNKQVGNEFDVRKYPKAMAKLKKQVKRTKEILSANTVAPIMVESLHNDIDFRSTITREKFEELCQDLWEQSLIPLKEVLVHSGLKVEDIYGIELIGGATRVPKLQVTLHEFFGRKDLDRHLDADEAIVLGAALHAANLSDGIKLNRKLGMIDGSSYGFLLDFDEPDLVKDENIDMHLMPRMKKLPSKMFRSIKYNKDFGISLSYEHANEMPSGASDKFAYFSVSGLGDTSDKYATRNISSPIKAGLHFSNSRSGVISLDRAEAVVEVSEWVEVPKKNISVENTTTNVLESTLDASPVNNTDDSNEGLASEGNSSNPSNVVEAQSTSDVVPDKVLKKKTYRIPLKIVDVFKGTWKVLSEESFNLAKSRLDKLNEKDAERRRTAELKNNLEEYIYSTREKLEDSVEIASVSAEAERQSFIDKLTEAQDWLYMDGEDASAGQFKDMLDSLKAVGEPIFFRLKEKTARPAACKFARNYLDEIAKIVENWGEDKPWLSKKKISEVQDEAGKVKVWLDEKEDLQKQASDSDNPVLTSEEVYNKVFKLQDKVASVNRIRKPKPKIEKPSKQEPESKEEDVVANSSADEPADTETTPPRAEQPPPTEDAVPEAEPHDEL